MVEFEPTDVLPVSINLSKKTNKYEDAQSRYK